jgi:hypothetical protein
MNPFTTKTDRELRQMIADSERRYMGALFLRVTIVRPGDLGWQIETIGKMNLATYRIERATAELAARKG